MADSRMEQVMQNLQDIVTLAWLRVKLMRGWAELNAIAWEDMLSTHDPFFNIPPRHVL